MIYIYIYLQLYAYAYLLYLQLVRQEKLLKMLHLLAFMEIPMCCLDLVEFLGFYFAGFFLFREVKAWRLVRTQSDGIGWWDARMLS